MIFASNLVTVVSAYCAPAVVSCSASDTINNFILNGESGTQIKDVSTGCSIKAYNNRTSASVNLLANFTHTAVISTQYTTSDFVAIWIDFNNNYVFESSERVAYQALNSTLNTPVPVVIPSVSAGGKLGTHRMRVSLAYANTPNPCSSGITYGETHDYTVNILTYSGKQHCLGTNTS